METKMKHEIQMPAGVYYIGDLCYVMSDRWDEVVDLMFPGDARSATNGDLTLADGTRFVSFSTAYGDGSYQGTNGKEYSVDAGLIGCILVSDCVDLDEAEAARLGSVETFDTPWIAYCDGNGDMSFNGIQINTAYQENYDEDDYEDDDYIEDNSNEDEYFGNVDEI
jgi:hypothetical protein